MADRYNERDRNQRDWERDWDSNYNRNYGYSYTGDYTRDYDPDWERDYRNTNQGWRGNYNRNYGYSYTGDPTRDYDRDYDRGFRDYNRDWERGSQNYRSGSNRDWDRSSNINRFSSRDYRYNYNQGMNRGSNYNPSSYNQGANRDYGQGTYDEEPTYFTYSEWWLIPGPYSGQGPKGYQRSDDRIFEDVCERLTQHGQIDASDMDIDVKDGEVTLKGAVDSRNSKRMAEDVVESVPGVKDVHNQLKVDKHKRHDQEQMQSQHQRQMQGGMIRRDQIHEGMRVMGSNGDEIGHVKEVRGNDFLVDRPVARDVYVPFNACQSVSGDRILLNVRSDQVDNQGWPTPETMDTGQAMKR